ncbi:MAG: shikimate kinase, partial [Planctomycetales bacterium]|nr:shikimate kinase [Planctomycetales bacterium]
YVGTGSLLGGVISAGTPIACRRRERTQGTRLQPKTLGSMKTIALIGYRGTGKTTVARILAERLRCNWIDADVELERRAGCSIAEMFAQQGESAFRDLETEVVDDLCDGSMRVLALGGGAVLRPENRQAIARCETVVWLQATADALFDRIAGDASTGQRRPQLTSLGERQEIESLLIKRAPFYRECATLTVDTEGKTPEEVAAELVEKLSLR